MKNFCTFEHQNRIGLEFKKLFHNIYIRNCPVKRFALKIKLQNYASI